MISFRVIAVIFSVVVSLAAAFAPIPSSSSHLNQHAAAGAANSRQSFVDLNMAQQVAAGEESRGAFLKRCSLICGGCIAASSVAGLRPAHAASLFEESSPSIVVAETAKLLDMSLPTYGDLSSTKASVGNTKSLYYVEQKTKDIPASQSKKTEKEYHSCY
mmetsp:Transcript_20409/g.26317  ORF Transcript_20409/g.26317 Transcript_20409/m.26317 type:complete len:160 (+) Transcript_20409:89-568(+)